MIVVEYQASTVNISEMMNENTIPSLAKANERDKRPKPIRRLIK
jgi:hypothetical protein